MPTPMPAQAPPRALHMPLPTVTPAHVKDEAWFVKRAFIPARGPAAPALNKKVHRKETGLETSVHIYTLGEGLPSPLQAPQSGEGA